MREGVRLDRRETALVVVDVQERLFGAMEPEQRDAMVRSLKILGAGARRLGLPILVTEQYPKGLGPTWPEVRDAMSLTSDKRARTLVARGFDLLKPRLEERLGPDVMREFLGR